jgi:putative hydrolase of the HAD superfamily
MQVRAITFDFWNTLYWDQGFGFGLVNDIRKAALRRALESSGVDARSADLDEAYTTGFKAYLEAWMDGRHYGAREQVFHVLAAFHAEADAETLETAVDEIEQAGMKADLALLPGVAEALPALAEAGVGLGVISDTGLTPGRILATFMERDGLLGFFGALTFSDQMGFPKPHPQMFLRTLAGLGVTPAQAAHVGDMPRTDIAGAQALGIYAVRMAAAEDHPEPPQADLVIRDHRQLWELAGLSGRR